MALNSLSVLKLLLYSNKPTNLDPVNGKPELSRLGVFVPRHESSPWGTFVPRHETQEELSCLGLGLVARKFLLRFVPRRESSPARKFPMEHFRA